LKACKTWLVDNPHAQHQSEESLRQGWIRRLLTGEMKERRCLIG
jgi:hypothetical protein